MNLVKSIHIALKSWTKLLLQLIQLIVILVISCNAIFAQSSKVDSLKSTLLNASTDIERITLMNKLSNALVDIHPKQSIIYAHKALGLSRKINDKEKEARTMFNLGLLFFETSATDSSLMYFEASEQLAERLNLGNLQSDNLMRIANWHRYHSSDSTKIVNYFFKSLAVSKAANYHYGTGRSYAKLASFYTKYKQIHLCEEYLKQSAKYYLKTKNGESHIAHYHNEVGNKIWNYNPKKSMNFYFDGLKFYNHPHIKVSLGKAYGIIGEPNTAIKYLNEAITQLDLINSERRLGLALAELAIVQLQMKNNKEAFKTCERAIVILEPLSLSHQSALPSVYETLGSLCELDGKDDSALQYYTKGLNKSNEINTILDPLKMISKTVKSNIALGNFYSHRDPYKGEKYCELALENAKKYSYTNLEIDACDCLYQIFKEEKQYVKALAYFERKEVLGDSLSTLKVEHAFELAQKDNELAQEVYEKERKDEKIAGQKRLTTTLGISSILGLLLISFLTLSRKRIRKQNTEIIRKTLELEDANLSLASSNKDLEQFAYVASHDLKSPLNNIIGFNSLISRSLKKEEHPKVHEYVDFIENSGKQMVQLIEDILQYSKLSNENSTKNYLDKINLNILIEEISKPLINNPKGKPISIEASEMPTLTWNRSKIFLLFKNLIENGIKYNESEQPKIMLSAKKENGINSIYIKDNGIGIEKENFDKVFVMFLRLQSRAKYEGTGLGLATCKKIVDEFKGEISLSSELGKGTTFKIQLPDTLIN